MSLRHWWQLNKIRVTDYAIRDCIKELRELHKTLEEAGGGFTPLAREIRDFLDRVENR
jgi:hypothetical protein